MINLLKSPPQINFLNTSFSKILVVPWWLEIKTAIPSCTYYFGPFSEPKMAKISQYGYIEDLLSEKARGITVEIKKLKPKELTIFED